MATVCDDPFTESSNISLPAHIPNVAGTGWVIEADKFTVIASTDTVRHTRNLLDRAREKTTLGADQMDVSALVSVANSSARVAGVCARMSTDNFSNQYEAYLQFKNSTTQDVFLYKQVGGTRTQLATATVTLAAGVAAVLKLSIRNGFQQVYVGGVLLLTTVEPDTTLSGRTYAGILMNGADTTNASLDNFLSESIVVPTIKAASETIAVATSDAASIGVLVGNTVINAAGPIAVALSETATIAITQLQKVPLETIAVATSESATIATFVAVTRINAADTIAVGLDDTRVVQVRIATDTAAVALGEATNLLKNTIPVIPTVAAMVWRLTSGDQARLPNMASRDLEL